MTGAAWCSHLFPLPQARGLQLLVATDELGTRSWYDMCVTNDPSASPGMWG